MKTKRLLTAIVMMMMVSAVSAQEILKSYSFIEAQGGVQLTSTNAPMDKLITPTAALSFGHYFFPAVGLRLHVNAWQSKSGFKDLGQYYKWKYVTTDADLLVNLTNLFSKNHNYSHPLNVILLGGFGLTNAWDNDELKALLAANKNLNMPLVWNKNRLSHNIRAGLRLETNVTKPLGVSLEVNANSLTDRFNSKLNNSDDWMFTAMLGLNFRFSHRYKKPAPTYTQVVQEIVEDQKAEVAPAPVVVEEEKVPEKKAVLKQENVKLHKVVFYNIRVSENETPSAIMEQVANFMKENKKAKITIVGYADKGTGNSRVNMTYSQKRAEQFKQDLVSRYGVDGNSISVDYKGDSVQPF
jgi:outer membrane protein OmpA-like peptidoglycan-associated protein